MTNFCRIDKHFSAYRNTANTYFAFNDANLDELFLKKLKPLRDVFLDIMNRRYKRKKKLKFKQYLISFVLILVRNDIHRTDELVHLSSQKKKMIEELKKIKRMIKP